jgi:hypothetical protein
MQSVEIAGSKPKCDCQRDCSGGQLRLRQRTSARTLPLCEKHLWEASAVFPTCDEERHDIAQQPVGARSASWFLGDFRFRFDSRHLHPARNCLRRKAKPGATGGNGSWLGGWLLAVFGELPAVVTLNIRWYSYFHSL